MARNHKQYTFFPRWKIEVKLTTISFLHIGCNEITYRPELKVEQEDLPPEYADINAFIKDSNKKPYIPGSTIKGNIRQWLKSHLVPTTETTERFYTLFGRSAEEEEQGCGGTAEFHNGIMTHELTDGGNLPYWEQEKQTSVETSTAIDRVTGTVVDKKLFYTEVVPPGVSFKLTITGAMYQQEAAILVAAIKKGFSEDCQGPITLGADDGNGQGRLKLESIHMSCLGKTEVQVWLENGTDDMAASAMKDLSPDEVAQYVTTGDSYLTTTKTVPFPIKINFRFQGPFLVNDPSRYQNTGDPNHQPLRDVDGNPRLPAKSVRGTLRSQAEKIIRTLGGRCCDPVNPCLSVFTVEEAKEKLCLACRLFGASGWKSRISVKKIEFRGADLAPDGGLEHKQDFVAIDRFHGGSKDTAKFAATFSSRPGYSIRLAISPDIEEWAKGLLILTLRDLQDGDITFGFGRAKGYGRIRPEQVIISGAEFLQAQSCLDSFREKCQETSQTYLCKPRAVPEPVRPPARQEAPETPAGQELFHNPYHFVPTPKPDISTWLPKEDFGSEMHDSHAIYRDTDQDGNSLYHGRISCTLTTETPIFVGGRRHEGEPQLVDHYLENGEAAIPATTLRGVLSALTEAASNSSMRVLDNALMSYRRPVGKDNLSAIGMVIIRDDQFLLYPLTLPTFDQKEGFPGEYRIMFPPSGNTPLKVYLENVYPAGKMKKFLDNKMSWSFNHPDIYYLPVPKFTFNANNTIHGIDTTALKKRTTKNIDLLFGVRLEGNPCPTTERKYENDRPGILRILGIEGRENNIPTTKKHELFLPVPEDFASNPKSFIDNLSTEELFKIPKTVVTNFEKLADQRTKPQIKHPEKISATQWLPYQLKGCARNAEFRGNDAQKMRLQHGDLVYFRPFPQAPRQVAEISFSSVWRGRVNKTVHSFFPPELLPFNKDRKAVSPAELLFGFVHQDKGEKAFSFAGKVHVASARQTPEQTQIYMDDEITLKILSSPKLPSPSLYFKGSGYIAKTGMDAGDIQPQGRKQYLHALVDPDDPQGVQKVTRNGGASSTGHYPWESRNNDSLKQKVRIKPLQKGVVFTFEMDFENCTVWELGMLLYALRPTQEYRHKIGMGKPIGLGTVRIDIGNLQLINRKQRYGSDNLDTARYNQSLPQGEEELRTLFSNTMTSDIRNAIDLLGDPDNIQFPVHYPQVREQDIEKQSFQWFVANDTGTNNGQRGLARQSIRAQNNLLESLNKKIGELPWLKRHEWLGR